MIVDQAAIAVRLLVEVPDGWEAEMRQALAQFGEVFFAEDFRFSLVGTPSHGAQFYNFRYLFATARTDKKSPQMGCCVSGSGPRSQRGEKIRLAPIRSASRIESRSPLAHTARSRLAP
jgi:hypothetical protein